jgi:sec-independent protein translocase protein TatB
MAWHQEPVYMLDIGWTELLVIAVILIVVVGPKDLPPMIRAFGKMTKRLRQTAGEFRAQFDEALREAELDDLKNSVNDIRSLNPANSIRETLNPLRQMGQDIKSDLERSTRPQSKPAPLDDGYEDNSILPDVPLGLGEPPKELQPVAQTPASTAAPATPVPASSTSAPVAVAEKKTATRKPAKPVDTPAKKRTNAVKALSEAPAIAAAPKAKSGKPAAAKAPAEKAKAAKAPAAKAPAAKMAATKAASTATKAPAKPRKTKSEDRA